jgi:phenylpropionate dioxygenase-like ring-hydroxylating dioxygenase large terminal subunit
VAREFLGRRLVAFRTATGRVAVLDARCSHLGADLGRGVVVGETIQCPFHHWRYGTDGFCAHIPTTDNIPEFARQTAYPVQERWGHVFVFNGLAPAFPLPDFDRTDVSTFVNGPLMTFETDCPWHLVAANAFDRSHYRAVHDRELIGEPVVDTPAPFARRIRYRSAITCGTAADALLRRLAGPTVDVAITCWGGAMFMVTAQFQRVCSYIVIITRPVNAARTLTEVIACEPQPRSPVARTIVVPASLRLRSWLTREFFRKDFDRLDGLRYNPRSLIESDREMIEFFHWIIAIHQTKPTETTT